jgi:hypothetical protein
VTARRLSKSQAKAVGLLGPLDGKRIPGGCEMCDAFQMVEPAGSGVWTLTVYHDDNCSFLKGREP